MCFFSWSSEVVREVRSALQGSRFELVVASSWAAFQEMAALGKVGVLGIADLDRCPERDPLQTLALRHPDLPILAVAEGATAPSALLRKLPPKAEVLFLRLEKRELPTRLGRLWLEAHCEELNRRMREATDVPYALRKFVDQLLTLRLRPGQGWTLTPKVVAICKEAGVTRSQVYSQSREAGIRPAQLVAVWQCLQFVAVHDLEDLSWPTVGHRAGYASLSGGSDLVLRGLGYRPGALPTGDIQYWLRWFETEWLQGLLAS